LPAFGGFLIEFAKFIQLVTEAGSVTIFFNTLKTAFVFLNDFLRSELGQRILELSAQILPLLAAFGLLAKVGGFFGKVVFGAFAQLLAPFTAITNLLVGMGIPLTTIVTTFLKFAGVAGLVITVFMLLWKNSEIFREAVMLMVSAVGGALKGAFNDITAAIKSVFPTFEGIGTVFKTLGNIIGTVVVPILTFVLTRAIGVVSGSIQALIFTVGKIKDIFLAVWNTVKGVFELVTGQTDKAAKSFSTAWQNSISAVKNAIKSIAAPFVAVLNSIVDAWNASFGKFSFTVPSWVPIIGGKKYDGFKLPRINLANLAEGGVVLPSPGGTIARIGEAGRPERIEPLDPEGLSVRDRAIIDRLSGGSGTTVNITVNPSEGMDERELAAIVSRQIAFQLRRGAA
jgi:phage-related protein